MVCYYSLGLLSNAIAVPKPSPLDTLSQHLSEKLAFGKLFLPVLHKNFKMPVFACKRCILN